MTTRASRRRKDIDFRPGHSGPFPRDLTGEKFGRLVVESFDKIERSKSGKSSWHRWWCVCDCGVRKSIVRGNLTASNGATVSCGCFQREDVSRRQLHCWLTDQDRAKRRMYSTAVGRAKRSGRDFVIDYEEFVRLSGRSCYYCGSPPSNTHTFKSASKYEQRVAKENYSGLDRVDNSKGYTLDNVVPCCKRCNLSKREMSVDEFSNWIARAYQHMRKSWWEIEPITSVA